MGFIFIFIISAVINIGISLLNAVKGQVLMASVVITVWYYYNDIIVKVEITIFLERMHKKLNWIELMTGYVTCCIAACVAKELNLFLMSKGIILESSNHVQTLSCLIKLCFVCKSHSVIALWTVHLYESPLFSSSLL